jgi:hypothetical protein
MNTEHQLERLRGLLARIQKNAALPRAAHVAAAPPPVVAAPPAVIATADTSLEETTMVRAIAEPSVEVDDVVVEI